MRGEGFYRAVAALTLMVGRVPLLIRIWGQEQTDFAGPARVLTVMARRVPAIRASAAVRGWPGRAREVEPVVPPKT